MFDKKRMDKKINKKVVGMVLLVLVVGLVAASSIVPQFNVCCEKTSEGAWCQNTLKENCDLSDGLRTTPTSCEATSFCKKGCCIDSGEGVCMRNTPEKVCEIEGGVWDADAQCNIPQCQLGCCVVGDQGSFVTLTRCKRLSAIYGLETNFNKEISDEISCIAIASANEKGACVHKTEEFEKTCTFSTKGDCKDGEFFAGRLCSDEKLGTNCGRTRDTTCIKGRDEVYFVDTCGNPANIYDASKIDDARYWSEVIPKANSCVLSDGLGNAKKCGNCDFFKGSICGEGRASYGDYICHDLSCKTEINGEEVVKKNGESWCYYDANTGKGRDPVGSRHFRYICMNGEVSVEACDDFRNQICIEDEVETSSGVFQEAACRTNRWQDCPDQENQKDCENEDKRDCYWVDGVHLLGAGQGSNGGQSNGGQTTGQQQAPTQGQPGQTFSGGATGGFKGGANPSVTGQVVGTGKSIFGGGDDKKEDKSGSNAKTNLGFGGGICLPDVPPGLQYWKSGDAQAICGVITATCAVEYEKKIVGDRKCVKHCECINPQYAPYANQLCSSMGDCGAYVNYVGKYTDDGMEVKVDGKKFNWQERVGQGILSDVMGRAGVGAGGDSGSFDLKGILEGKNG